MPFALNFRVPPCPVPPVSSNFQYQPPPLPSPHGETSTPAPALQPQHHHQQQQPETPRVGILKAPACDVRALRHMIRAVEAGAVSGNDAEDADLNSVGGSYFLLDERRQRVGVFKPCDEEAFAPNNPRAYSGSGGPADEPRPRRGSVAYGRGELPPHPSFTPGPEGMDRVGGGDDADATFGMKRGITPQSSAVREVAAYLLDGGLAGVPRTAYMSYGGKLPGGGASQDKVGSFQEYISHMGHSEDWSPSMFDIHDVQAIAALDIRLLNQDRHTGNMLVCEALSADAGSPSTRQRMLNNPPESPFVASRMLLQSGVGDGASLPRDVYAYTHIPCGVRRGGGFSSGGFASTPRSGPAAFQAAVGPAPPSTPIKNTIFPPALTMSLKADLLSPRSVESPLASPELACRGLMPGAPSSPLKPAASCSGSLATAHRGQKTPPSLESGGGKLRLVPIDHGFTLPHPLACDESSLAWMQWPQAKQATTDRVKAMVEAIDLEADVSMLDGMFEASQGPLQLPRDCIMALRVGTALLQGGIAYGLSLYELGSFISGPDGYASYPPADNSVQKLTLAALERYRLFHNAPLATLVETLGAPAYDARAHNFLELFEEELRAHFDARTSGTRSHRSPTI